jgi:hypothetical protein
MPQATTMQNDEDAIHLPAISQQVRDLVLAGSIDDAENTFSDTVEKFGDLAVVAVLDQLEPQVTALHLTAFDGGKLSLATFLVSPKAWAESLAFFAATWTEEAIADEPEMLAESLFTHIHGMLYASDDLPRRAELIHQALATDWGTTAFAVLLSTAAHEVIELANDIYKHGVHRSGQTTSDHDVIPLAVVIATVDEDAWERVLFELFPNWHPGENEADQTDEEEGDSDEPIAPGRSTQDLMLRLRRQVPSTRRSTRSNTLRQSMGEDIFS